jgi:hypothetical protein
MGKCHPSLDHFRSRTVQQEREQSSPPHSHSHNIMARMERDIFESQNRAAVYLDLLGFAALVEANPKHFLTEPADRLSSQTWPSNPAANRLSLFHRVLESCIESEQPNRS